MREILEVKSATKAVSVMAGIGSLGLMIYGIYEQSFWSGFGLVLLMTSLLLIVSLSDYSATQSGGGKRVSDTRSMPGHKDGQSTLLAS